MRITSPDRVLYPERGMTKRELVEYWSAVADAALPHLARRPLTLVRCPSGTKEHCFFQKHWGEGMPDRVPRVEVSEHDGAELYMVVDDLPAVLALVQVGVLEFHVWGARADRLDRPDRLIFDLDPDPDVDWGDVVATARGLRERLESLGLASFVKTTGGKGLHVVVPIVRRSSWDEAKAFTRAVAERLVSAAPDRFTASMSKRRRKGKIFIDYLRNVRNATSVAAYSPRARAGAPVSVPLGWEELDADGGPPRWTVAEVPDRLVHQKADPWAGMAGLRQSITVAMKKELGLR